MYTNADVTLYLYGKVGNVEQYARLPVKGVYWEGVKQSAFIKTGQKDARSFLVVIPLESLERPLKFTQGKDLAVNGIIDEEIDCSSQEAMSKSLAVLKAHYGFVTVMTVDERLYGVKSSQHYELSCK